MNNTWLIFRHELAGTVRRAGFIVMTLVVPVVALLVIGIVKLAQASDAALSAETEVVGFVDESGAFAQFTDQGAVTLRRYGSADEATRALVDGGIKEYFVIPADLVTASSLALFTEGKDQEPSGTVVAAIQTFLSSNLLAGKVPAATIHFVEAPPSFVTTRLDPQGEVVTGQGGIGIAIPLIYGVLLLFSLAFNSTYLLQGLANEKESRLMEILVSRVSPGELLAGKVLGLGAAGLAQVTAWLLFVVALTILVGSGSSLHVPAAFYALAVAFFLVSFFLFATLSAAVGAISTNVGEAGQLSALYMLFPAVPLWIMALVVSYPESPAWIILSFFPLTAPTMVVARMGIGGIPAWQIAASLGVLGLSAAGGLLFANRIFRRYLLVYEKTRLGEVVRGFQGQKGSIMKTGVFPAAAPGEAKPRLAYLDNLRSLVIFLVVVMHSNVTYSGLGSWYYTEGDPRRLDILSTLVFALYGSFTQAWFMGLLFFIAAYFAAKSLARRGAAAFVKERLFRLGVPLLIYMFVIDPFISVVILRQVNLGGPVGVGKLFLGYLTSFGWVSATGPLWFVEALLIFSLLYTAWRAIRPSKGVTARPPGTLAIILIILATGLAAFSIRVFQPIGTSVANLQLCYFASYIALFLLGLHAGERKWLESYPEKTGVRWFIVALCVGLPLWLLVVGSGGELIYGGLRWQSLAYALWESFVAIGFSIGLIAFFRKYLNVENGFTRVLAGNSFSVYMFHAPILISISLVLRTWQAPFLLKHVAVAPLAFAVTLGVSFLALRRIPGLKTVLR